MKLSKSVSTMVQSISARDCSNNTQKALLALLKAASDEKSEGFISRSSMRIPNVGARIRSLRTKEFGEFNVECVRGEGNSRGGYSTYYRLDPRSVTTDKVRMVFRDVASVCSTEQRSVSQTRRSTEQRVTTQSRTSR